MDANFQSLEDYRRIEQAIHYLEAQHTRQPELAEVAAAVGLSEFHFQRLFTRWVGISRKRVLQYLTKEYAKQMLERSAGLLETAYASGLSGPSRLHDLFVQAEAVTPGEFKRAGQGLTIRYGFHPSPFGEVLLAQTPRGLCGLQFSEHLGREATLAELSELWHADELLHDQQSVAAVAARIFNPQGWDAPLALHLNGTNFQLKVWEGLLRIPPGSAVTYAGLAGIIGMPRAARAVGGAVGANPIAVLIPCHRVIRGGGEFGSYHYGSARKKALLGWEAAGGRSGMDGLLHPDYNTPALHSIG
ncbi:MAG: methylated-DNA--[protein]-cysteine S-methyltransferase [Anaerolineae bacterium]|nr:methylated-DNA--[protein]-cysteine S-methyltransferase [Anaerolineae bacterium]